jgi:trans-2,3-dihydro-3-hydroxyanthranilate isomerase
MRRRYFILDVFTDTKLAGNPLAVVLDSDGLDDAAMQKIAREFNLSETVFCSAPQDPVNSAALRIFTPAAELPFAGHPTIGTAILLGLENAPDLIAREDVGLVLEEKVGAISCSVRRRRGEAPHARFEAPRAAEAWAAPPDPAALAAKLGLVPADMGFDGHLPSCFSAGNPMTFVPVASLEALGRAELNAAPGEKAMLYLFARAEPQGETQAFRSRLFCAGYGIVEDPATGSAAAAFPGALAAGETFPDGEHDLILLQGVEMGRPSRIGVAFATEGGRAGPATIGGSAVVVMQGHLDL